MRVLTSSIFTDRALFQILRRGDIMTQEIVVCDDQNPHIVRAISLKFTLERDST